MSPRASTLARRAEEAEERAVAAKVAALRAALVEASGAVTRAAAALGIPERTLRRRIGEAGLADWLRETYPRSARQPKRGGS